MSKLFFDTCPLPIYIVLNIDRGNVLKAVEYNDLKPAGIIASEDAKTYKPRAETLECALKCFGVSAKEVLYIEDSLSSNVARANACGIKAIWVNWSGKEVPLEVFETEYF